MNDIASALELVINKLDGMTYEIVPKNYGTDIASRIEHISKQLEFIGEKKEVISFGFDITENSDYAQTIEDYSSGDYIFGETILNGDKCHVVVTVQRSEDPIVEFDCTVLVSTAPDGKTGIFTFGSDDNKITFNTYEGAFRYIALPENSCSHPYWHSVTITKL